MADKKVDATTGELVDEKMKEETSLDPVLSIHCKPVYNYQSVEFDWFIYVGNAKEDIAKMEEFYSEMLAMLVRVSQNAPQKDFKPVQQVEEPATEKQIEVMNTFHIKYPKDVTRKQAQELIKANISAVK